MEQDREFDAPKGVDKVPTDDDTTAKIPSPPLATGVRPFQCAASFGGAFSPKPASSSYLDTTANMLEGRWTRNFGWDPTYIVPFQNVTLNPGARILLYGQQVFDSIQATLGFDNRIRLFRPEEHLKRLRRTAIRLALPDFDEQELLICIKRLVLSDASYIPPAFTNGSLEVRIVLMGSEANAKISRNNEATLYVFLIRHLTPSIVEHKKSRVLYADPKYVRSWIGSLGQYLTSANYAGLFYVTNVANSLGCNDMLWLYGKEEFITQLNEANIFVFIFNERNKRELITPSLNGLTIPGITRQSILEITRYWNEFIVTERSISVHEIRTLQIQRRLIEIFATNTFGNAIPVIRIHYEPTRIDIHIPTLEQRDSLWERLNRALHSIEYGLVDHQWGQII
ncbi:branched-chain-amino-acid aminotransferase: cytosolic-like protein [Dinothrombium tinctorium]|uniref:Branched-chain-amino-acid aminotransferase: cytosolic-like protein n=1 Tax=Dinothrombium tinctorium TaxID=1965070 RepID=A0A3S4R3Y3_9ACAR|nr:branched-chain-amino-acid aminotransferase: cytosolic-like protein [Dinothrombium tinctorium]